MATTQLRRRIAPRIAASAGALPRRVSIAAAHPRAPPEAVRVTLPTHAHAQHHQRHISFLAQPPPTGPRSTRARDYAAVFIDALRSSGSSGAHALTHAHSEEDVLRIFDHINARLGVPQVTLPPATAWSIALRHLLGGKDDDDDSEGAEQSLLDRVRSELDPAKGKDPYRYDAGRVYEASSLYSTYLRRTKLADEHEEENPDHCIEAALLLPLLRAYTHSFVPDIARAFALYADWLAHASHASSLRKQQEPDKKNDKAEAEMYAVLIALCLRNRLYARALRLVRDMTVRGISHLFASSSNTQSAVPSSIALTLDDGDDDGISSSGAVPQKGRAKQEGHSSSRVGTTLPVLFLTRWDRVSLLVLLMQSASSYAEAYAIYWRMQRLWSGVQVDALSRRLQHREGGDRAASVVASASGPQRLLHWLRRFASQGDSYAYLGDGIDLEGQIDTRPAALAYWTRDIPSELDEDAAESESVLLTEEELMDEEEAQGGSVLADSLGTGTSRFSLGWILGRIQTRSRRSRAQGVAPAAVTIYASPEERMARMSASPFPASGWRHLLSSFLDLPCSRRDASRSSGGSSPPHTVWIPAPPELVTSIFWDMLRAGCAPPPQVYTQLLHYYTRFVKTSRQTGGEAGLEVETSNARDREVQAIRDHQRRLIASEAVASLHKLIYLDVQLAPDLPLINALMNAYGHLGQLGQVLEIWQSLVNLSGGARSAPLPAEPGCAAPARVVNRMDARSVAIVLDACGFAAAGGGALTRARKVVAWVRHRDRLAMSMATAAAAAATTASVSKGFALQESSQVTTSPSAVPPPPPRLLMSKGAWDAWLECLCRRGQLREAFYDVFLGEMVPVLAEQRRIFGWENDRPAAAGCTHAPDAKTLGTLLRFAARERDAAASSRPNAASGRRGSASAPARTGSSTITTTSAAVGSTFLGQNSEPGNTDDGSPGLSGRQDAQVWNELRAWIRREMPWHWDAVQRIGNRP